MNLFSQLSSYMEVFLKNCCENRAFSLITQVQSLPQSEATSVTLHCEFYLEYSALPEGVSQEHLFLHQMLLCQSLQNAS